MSEGAQPRRSFGLAWYLGAAVTSILICVLSYRADRSFREEFFSSTNLDLFDGNLQDDWSAFGALSANQVRLIKALDGTVGIDVVADTPSRSDESSGVSHTVPLSSPGWYEFTGEFRAMDDDSQGIGAQLELQSSRWRFIVKADSRQESRWKEIEVYFRPSDSDPSAEISCRFWSSSAGRTGRAFFRDMRLVKIVGPPPQTAVQFDLQRKEEARLQRIGQRRKDSLVGVGATVLFLIAIAGVCWRSFE